MKCQYCGKKVVRYPLFKEQDGKKIIQWKNLFKMDIYSIALFVITITLIIGYKADIAKCEDAIENPCKFCTTTGCCRVYYNGTTEAISDKGQGQIPPEILYPEQP